MPRTTTRINARRATTVALTSLATLTLLPLLAPAKPTERALLLLAAVPTAALLGYLAGYAAGSVTHLDAGQLHATQQDIQLRAARLQAAQRSASTTVASSAPAIRLVTEPIPPPGTGSPIGSGDLAGLARPPADQHHDLQHQGLSLVPTPSREAFTGTGTGTGTAPGELDETSPHLTLIVTQHPAS